MNVFNIPFNMSDIDPANETVGVTDSGGNEVALFYFPEVAEFTCLAVNERQSLKDRIKVLEKQVNAATEALKLVKDLRDFSEYGLGQLELTVSQALKNMKGYEDANTKE